MSLNDLLRFFDAAEAFQTGATAWRAAALAVGCSVSALHDTFTRLEHLYNVALVSRGDKTIPTKLTADGVALYEALRALDSWDSIGRLVAGPDAPPARPQLRVAMSRSLFASPLLFPELTERFRDYRARYDLELDLDDQFDFPNKLSALERNELDAVLVWVLSNEDAEGRETERNPWLVRQALGLAQIDVVFVAARLVDIERLAVAPNGQFEPGVLATASVATVARDLEPQTVRSVLPDRRGGGRRFSAGTIENVLAHVRAGVVTYGVVPAIYRELDHFRRLGQLVYSPRPISKARVDLITHKTAQAGREYAHVREFEKDLTKVFRNLGSGFENLPRTEPVPKQPLLALYLNRPCWGERRPDGPRHLFPTDPANPLDLQWYANVQFGYFVDYPREPDGSARPNTEPLWRSERVRVDSPGANDSGGITFALAIYNQDEDWFDADATLAAHVLVVTARLRPGRPSRNVTEFRSVFSWCDQSAGVMYGTWRGLDPDARPVAYSTIWSHNPLELRELQAVANHAMNTIGVTANATDGPAPNWPRE